MLIGTLYAVVLEAVKLCRAIALEGSQFVLFNEKRTDRPPDKRVLERGFRTIFGRIGIDDEARKTRNLVFHGLRHTFVSMPRAAGLPDFAVMRLAGYKSLQMTERYSHAENVVDFTAARLALDGGNSSCRLGGSFSCRLTKAEVIAIHTDLIVVFVGRYKREGHLIETP